MSGIGHNSGIAAGKTLTDKDKTTLAGVLVAAGADLNVIASLRGNIKDAVDNAEKETGVSKKLIKRMIKTFHKATYETDTLEDKEFAILYTDVEGFTAS